MLMVSAIMLFVSMMIVVILVARLVNKVKVARILETMTEVSSD